MQLRSAKIRRPGRPGAHLHTRSLRRTSAHPHFLKDMLAACRACGKGRGVLELCLALLQYRSSERLSPRVLAPRRYATAASKNEFDVLSSAPPPAALPVSRSIELAPPRRSTSPKHVIAKTPEIDACKTREDVLALFARQRRDSSVQISEFHIYKFFAVLQARTWSDQDKASENRRAAAENMKRLMTFTCSRFSAPLGARTLAIVLQACGSIINAGLPCVSPEWLDEFWHASQLALHSAPAESMTLLLDSASKFRTTPPPAEWFAAFFAASGAAIARGQFDGSDCVKSLLALARLSAALPASWLDSFWSASGPMLGRCKTQEHANVLHACGRLRLAPTVEWLNYYWAASHASLRLFNARSLCTMLTALGTLRVRPPAAWYGEFSAASTAAQAQFTASEVSQMKKACALLDLALPAHWAAATDKGEALALPTPSLPKSGSEAQMLVPRGPLSHADHVTSLMQAYVREKYSDSSETSPNRKV